MSSSKCTFVFELDLAKGHTCEPHTHACTEIVLNAGCEGWLHDDKRKEWYEDRTLFIYQPGLRHWITNERAGRQLCVGVNGCGAGTLPAVLLPGTEAVWEIRARLIDEVDAGRPCQDEYLDLLAGLLVLELRRLTATAEDDHPHPSQAERAKEILDTRFQEALSITEIASALYICPDYLRQLFKKSFGDSPMHYLVKRRIEYASLLLRQGEDPVREIARKSGFDSPYYFSRLFRRVMGVSPTEYRSAE